MCLQGFGEETEGKVPPGRYGSRWERNIKMGLQELGWGSMDWTGSALHLTS